MRCGMKALERMSEKMQLRRRPQFWVNLIAAIPKVTIALFSVNKILGSNKIYIIFKPLHSLFDTSISETKIC